MHLFTLAQGKAFLYVIGQSKTKTLCQSVLACSTTRAFFKSFNVLSPSLSLFVYLWLCLSPSPYPSSLYIFLFSLICLSLYPSLSPYLPSFLTLSISESDSRQIFKFLAPQHYYNYRSDHNDHKAF